MCSQSEMKNANARWERSRVNDRMFPTRCDIKHWHTRIDRVSYRITLNSLEVRNLRYKSSERFN